MSAAPEAESFFRLRVSYFDPVPHWIESFAIWPEIGVRIGLTQNQGKARIVIDPTPETLAKLGTVFGPVTCEPATFESWVEQEGEPSEGGARGEAPQPLNE